MPKVFPTKGQPGTWGLFTIELAVFETLSALTRQAENATAKSRVRHMMIGSMPVEHGLRFLSNFVTLQHRGSTFQPTFIGVTKPKDCGLVRSDECVYEAASQVGPVASRFKPL